MRKDQLDTETEYAYWNGHGSFRVPRQGHEAQRAVKSTLRVRVIDTAADADTTDWLVPPRAKGVLFKVLNPETGEDTYRDNKLVTMWESTARAFVMSWEKFREIVKPIIKEIEEDEKRESELDAFSEAVAEAIATRMNLDKEKHVRVNIHEYRYRGGHRRTKEEIMESIDIGIAFETIKEIKTWLGLESEL